MGKKMRKTIAVEHDCVVNNDQLFDSGEATMTVQLILEVQRYTLF